MNWETIRKQIEEDDQLKWDLRVPASAMKLDTSKLLEVQRNGSSGIYGLAPHAVTQLCQRLGIPARYFKRLPADIQAQLANYDLERLEDSGFLLRGRGESIRAVLSDRYVAYGNREVVDATLGAVASDGLAIKSFALEDRFMFIKLISTTLVDEVLELKAGVMISNSEVGWAQVSVEPFLYRKPCTNDLIVTEDVAFRHRHLHLETEEFTRRIASSIASGLKLAEVAVSSAWAADGKSVADPTGEILRLGKQWKLNKQFVEKVQAAFQAEPRSTRWGLANSFTRAAQQLKPVERVEVERFAGSLLAA